jgi:hypothetical protein
MFGYDQRGEPLLLLFIKRSNPDLKRPEEPVGLALVRDKLPPGKIKVFVDGKAYEDAEPIEQLARAIEEQWHGAAEVPVESTVQRADSQQQSRVRTGALTGLRVKLKLDRDFDAFTENQEEKSQLMRKIWEELSCPNAKEVSIRKGCVEMTLHLPPEEAERLYWAAKRGELDEFGLIDIELVEVLPVSSETGLQAALGEQTTLKADQEEESPFVSASSPSRSEITPDSGGYAPRSRSYHQPSTSVSLLEHIQGGDNQDWQRFVTLYAPLIYRWCQRSGLHRADADDVIQDVFVAVWQHIADFRSGGHRAGGFRAWLNTITHRVVIDHVRRSQRQARTFCSSGLLKDSAFVSDAHPRETESV